MTCWCFFPSFFELKRDDAFKGHPFCRKGMLELQNARMQQQAGRLGLDVGGGVQGIAQDGMANAHHVKPQLMCAAGHGFEFNAGGVI